jgi:hypothetical protein
MSEKPQYGENGFIPTVSSVRREGSTLVFETIGGGRESDIISKEGEPLMRRAAMLEEE